MKSILSLLTPQEQAYLFGNNNTKEFTNAQKRYIRCRLKKKLRLLGEELNSCNVAAAEHESCNALNEAKPSISHDCHLSFLCATVSPRLCSSLTGGDNCTKTLEATPLLLSTGTSSSSTCFSGQIPKQLVGDLDMQRNLLSCCKQAMLSHCSS